MKSYDTKPGETVSDETEHLPLEPVNAEVPPAETETAAEPEEEVLPSAQENVKAIDAEPVLADEVIEEEQVRLPELEEEDDAEDEKEYRKGWFRDFRPPTRTQLLAWTPFWAVILLGALLRFWGLGDKPLHHDESLHAYFSLGLLHNLQNWGWCVGLNNPPAGYSCYHYDPLLHGPFQFHAIALVYQISQWLGAPDNGVNTTTVRIAAALLGTLLIGLPYFVRDYLGRLGAWLACLLLAVSPSMVYFSRFAREDIYMACFTLLMVVSIGRYMRDRKMRWLLLGAAGFALSYATSEATFLTIAVFGSFLGALVVWEIGSKFRWQAPGAEQEREPARYLPRTFASLAVLVYFLLLAVVAKIFFAKLDELSTYIIANTNVANLDLQNLEAFTVGLIPWLGILLGIFVFSILLREIYGRLPKPGRRGLARFVDRRQPVLDAILTMPWTHWFFGLILAWTIFMVLFTVVFTNIWHGIGDGIWMGLYYWLEQQNVARGGQPWYYYILLIPLYEQIGVVFALIGIGRSLRRPNRFRLFMIYWFLGDFFLYSWAGEKMPWLMIFMTMPMLILAAIGLEPCLLISIRFVKERFLTRSVQANEADRQQENPSEKFIPWSRSRVSRGQAAWGLFGVVMAVLLLLPTLHNMYEVSYVDAADGPQEMMVYVQTTPDVNTVMNQIDQLDKLRFGGKHQMRIAVTSDATWPFAWYLRDYPNLCFNFDQGACPTWVGNVPVIITGGDNPYGDISKYASNNGSYLYHQYHMRSWWDEGYKLPACQVPQQKSLTCSDPNLGSGVGPLLWLSYGDNPPPNAKFNLGLAAQRVWNWWWHRQSFGSTDGAYDMVLFIQKGLGVNP